MSGGRGRSEALVAAGFRPMMPAPGGFRCVLRPDGTLEPVIGVDDDTELMSLESSHPGRFGLARRGRGHDTSPLVAQGTPALARKAAPQTTSLEGPTLDHEPDPGVGGDEDAPLDRDATERGLLAAIAAGDDSCRLVYADWLEDRSEHARAGYLRLELLVASLRPGDPRVEACARQLRELGQHIDADWRARVARPAIEGCSADAFRCPGRWDALARTDREAVRYCSLCVKHVQYFSSVDEARAAAQQGGCVAIDRGAERWENDLADPGTRCESCSRRVVSTARYCPHCGDRLHETSETTLARFPVDAYDKTEIG
jgi:uncharacterized protein (TIGR02996 family)